MTAHPSGLTPLPAHLRTARTTVRRGRKRAEYRREVINSILDEALFGYVGFCADGQPIVLPMVLARDGDVIYLHGAQSNRLLRKLRHGLPACLNVTLVDGLVLSRSALNHSFNYRSVVVLAEASLVTSHTEKLAALNAIVDQVAPGNSRYVRSPSLKEARRTQLLRMPITEGSAKIRTGPPGDEPEDQGLPLWAGVLPVRTVIGPPVPDPLVPAGLEPPDHLAAYTSPGDKGHALAIAHQMLAGPGQSRGEEP
jgi:nitroimidazol reductase NimA-like FMN-containing flavoprotein (pyridoxamine 5'-phosphate oxidase superfamily)